MDDEVAADSEDVCDGERERVRTYMHTVYMYTYIHVHSYTIVLTGIPDTSRFKSILSTRSLLPLISTLNEKPRPLGWVAGATTDDDEVQ